MTSKFRFTLYALAVSALAAVSTALPAAAATPIPAAPALPILVGSDIIVAIPQSSAWALLQDTSGWSAWNTNVTDVAQVAVSGAAQSALSLTAGVEFTYQWQGKKVDAVVQDAQDSSRLLWKGAGSGPDVNIRWLLRPTDPSHSLVSLRAILRPAAPDTLITAASNETQAWMSAFQAEAARRAAAITPVPTPAPKKHHHKKAASAPASAPAPTAAAQ